MVFDWQAAVVGLVILAASLYIARRAWRKLRSALTGQNTEAACASGCGKCDEARSGTAPARTLVQIDRRAPALRRRGR
jgi:hypothetical protein